MVGSAACYTLRTAIADSFVSIKNDGLTLLNGLPHASRWDSGGISSVNSASNRKEPSIPGEIMLEAAETADQ